VYPFTTKKLLYVGRLAVQYQAMTAADTKHAVEVFDVLYQHAAADAIIATGSRRPTRSDKEGHGVHPLMPMKVSDRSEILPLLFEAALETTCYYMPNIFCEAALHRWRKEADAVPLTEYKKRITEGQARPLYFHAANHHIKQLVAVAVDLDVGRHKDDLNSHQAVAQVLTAAHEGTLPLPSMTAASGRGAYCLWLLYDVAAEAAPEATPANIATWRKVTTELVSRLQHLKADKIATHLGQWLKTPGTIDTKTALKVIYSIHTASTDTSSSAKLPRYYDLDGLADSLALMPPLKAACLPPVAKQTKTRPTAANQTEAARRPLTAVCKPLPPLKRNSNAAAEKHKQAAEIELIAQHRRGIAEGYRTAVLFRYYNLVLAFLKVSKHPQAADTAQQRTMLFNGRYNKPPLKAAEVQKMFRQKPKRYNFKNDSLADVLMVTDAEAVELQLESLLPPTARQRKEALAAAQKSLNNANQAIDKIIANEIINELQRNESPTKAAAVVTARLAAMNMKRYSYTDSGKLVSVMPTVSRQLVMRYKKKLKAFGRLPSQQSQTLFRPGQPPVNTAAVAAAIVGYNIEPLKNGFLMTPCRNVL